MSKPFEIHGTADSHTVRSVMHANAHIVADVVTAVLNAVEPFLANLTPEAKAECGSRAIDAGLKAFNCIILDAAGQTMQQVAAQQAKDAQSCVPS
jgi:hypothetical protein